MAHPRGRTYLGMAMWRASRSKRHSNPAAPKSGWQKAAHRNPNHIIGPKITKTGHARADVWSQFQGGQSHDRRSGGGAPRSRFFS